MIVLAVVAPIVLILMATFAMSDEKPAEPTAEDLNRATVRQAVTTHLTEKEPKVIEAFITDADVLYISVEDDGTRRDGLAEYFCQILNDEYPEAAVNRAKVVQAHTTGHPDRDNSYGVLLGEYYCN